MEAERQSQQDRASKPADSRLSVEQRRSADGFAEGENLPEADENQANHERQGKSSARQLTYFPPNYY